MKHIHWLLVIDKREAGKSSFFLLLLLLLSLAILLTKIYNILHYLHYSHDLQHRTILRFLSLLHTQNEYTQNGRKIKRKKSEKEGKETTR